MEFRNWLENAWSAQKPNLQYNEAEVNNFVEKMADQNKNAQAVFFAISRQNLDPYALRYVGKIGNNLLIADDPKLKQARGLVTSKFSESAFRFYYNGGKAGNLYVIHPPVVYDNTDKQLLHGVIVHELQHAQDWIDGNLTQPDKTEFNIELYAKNISEARAYASELRVLLKKLGGDVLSAISQKPKIDILPNQTQYVKRPQFKFSNDLMPFAVEFLTNFREEISPAFSQPPAIVKPDDTEQRVQMLVSLIMRKMQFRNFLVKSK